MSEQPAERPEAQAHGSGAIVQGAADTALAGLRHAIPPGVTGIEAAPMAASSATVSVSRLFRAKWLILGIFVFLSGATVPWVSASGWASCRTMSRQESSGSRAASLATTCPARTTRRGNVILGTVGRGIPRRWLRSM